MGKYAFNIEKDDSLFTINKRINYFNIFISIFVLNIINMFPYIFEFKSF